MSAEKYIGEILKTWQNAMSALQNTEVIWSKGSIGHTTIELKNGALAIEFR